MPHDHASRTDAATDSDKKHPPMNLHIRIRALLGTPVCRVWLMQQSGSLNASLLSGDMTMEQAVLLAETLGLEIKRERMGLANQSTAPDGKGGQQ